MSHPKPSTPKKTLTRRDLIIGAAAGTTLIGTNTISPALAKAPMLGINRPVVYRFKLGAFEITNILDGVIARPPHPIFGQNQTKETVEALARSQLLSPAKMEVPFVVSLVNTGNELVLFDTGGGAARRSPTNGQLRNRLSDAGYTPEQIDIVVITHGHPDHIGGLMEDGKPAFPNARYVFGETEFDAWKNNKGIPEKRAKNRDLFLKTVVPLADKATFIKPGQSVVSGIDAIDAFGHTPGMLAYNIESNGKRLMLWADVTNHFAFSLMKPEWHVVFDHDKDKAIAARKNILSEVASAKIPAIGYHMPFPSVGYVEQANDSFRWVPVSYQLLLE